MALTDLAPAVVALLPVVAFLALLLSLDSYKLVRIRTVLVVIACGALLALFAYPINGSLLRASGLSVTTFVRYLGPLSEEILKTALIVALVRTHRVGFLVDAAILGFSIGTGFSVMENVYYLRQFPDAGLGTWIVRGFGTALMHGGTTALVGVAGMALLERSTRTGVWVFVPGLVAAVLVHSGYNHLLEWPKTATVTMLLILPAILYLVFERSDKAVGDWLGTGFDADAERLALLNSGRIADSPIGRYLETLKHTLAGPIVADVLCYVRLHTELALRAKGVLMMRENGFEARIDDDTRAKFEEMRYLERSIGRTMVLAVHPMLHMSHKELWQIYMLDKS